MVHAQMQVVKYSLYIPAQSNSLGEKIIFPLSGRGQGLGACLAPWSGTRERTRAQVPDPGPQALAGILAGIWVVILSLGKFSILSKWYIFILLY